MFYFSFTQSLQKVDETMSDEDYMRLAVAEASKAAAIEEVPIGCVIVHQDQVIATGYNKRNTQRSALAHAEIEAIGQACAYLGDWRLEDCTLYVSLEPCAMCAGAILQARVPRLVYGASNGKGGSVDSLTPILNNNAYNHTVEVVSGVLGEVCGALMTQFFADLRQRRKLTSRIANGPEMNPE